jgi:hypothetical protein
MTHDHRDRRSVGMSPSTKQFVRHYAEMVAAMFLGMAVLGPPAGWVMGAFGTSWGDISTELMILVMATTMTLPMVGWMAYRGHGTRANAEMSASMYVPAFAAIALKWSGMVTGAGVLMVIEHVAMLLCMAGVMLLRPAEYMHHHDHDVDAMATAQVPA